METQHARFDRWALAILVASIVFTLLGVAVAGQADQAEPWLRVAIIVAGVLSALVLVAAVAGLAGRSAWARPLVVALLWLMVIVGLVGVVADLGGGKLTIPVLAIAAAAVLRSRPHGAAAAPSGHAHRVAAAGVATTLVAAALVPAASYALTPGNSPMSVAPDALDLRATIACTAQSGVPAEARLTATWAWRQHEWLPMGDDALALRWRVVDADGQPMLSAFYLREAPGTGYTPTVNPGRASATGPYWLGTSGPAGNRASDLVQDGVLRGAHVEPVVVDVGRQRLNDDSFAIVIAAEGLTDTSGAAGAAARTAVPDHGTLAFDVAYLHLGRWIAWADSRTCTW